MSNDLTIASLGLKVESGQVAVANEELLQFVKQSKQAEEAADDLGDAAKQAGKDLKGAGDQAQAAGDKTERAGRGAEVAGRRTEIAGNKVRNSLLSIAGVDGRLRGTINLLTNFSLPVAGAVAGIATAVGILTRAFFEGQREATAFARAIALTGNRADVSVAQLNSMAAAMDRVSGTNREAAATLALFVRSGQVGRENLQEFASVAQSFAKTAGVPIEQVVDQFAKLAEKPTEASEELQRAIGHLNPVIYQQIAALEKAGRVTDAAALAQRAYADHIDDARRKIEPHLGYLERAWGGIKKGAGEAWDAMLGIGRDTADADRLTDLIAQRNRLTNPGLRGLSNDPTGQRLKAIIAEIAEVEKRIAAEEKLQTQERARLALIDANIQRTKDAAAASDELAKAQDEINNAWLQFDASAVERGLSATLASYQAVGDELETMRAANLVTDQEYFEQRRKLAQDSAAAEIAAINETNEALRKKQGLTATEIIARDNQIAENQQQIANLRIASASELRRIDIEEQASIRETARAYEEAAAAAESYVRTLTRRYQLESQGQGLGNRERERLRERASIEAEFEERRQQIIRDDRLGRLKEGEAEKLLDIENDALQRSLDAYDQYYDELTQKQSDWRVGASEALANFADEAADRAGQVERALSNAFNGATDALVEFAMTGKGNFGDLAKSIIADLLRIELKIALSNVLKPLFDGLGLASGMFGGGGVTINGIGGPVTFGGGRAMGGPVQKGVTYLVNENTPKSEMFTAPADGWVSPQGGGLTIINHNTFGSGMNRAEIEASLDRRDAQLLSQFRQDGSRGRWRT